MEVPQWPLELSANILAVPLVWWELREAGRCLNHSTAEKCTIRRIRLQFLTDRALCGNWRRSFRERC